MKNITAILLISSFLFSSCINSINQDDLIGNWDVVHSTIKVPALSKSDIEETKEYINGLSYIFSPDGRFVNKEPNGNVFSGWWVISEGKLQLRSNPDKPASSGQTYTIIKLNDDELYLKSEMKGQGYIKYELDKKR